MIDFKAALADFKKNYYADNKELFRELGRQQKPHTLFIACSDSRVSPELLTGARPGELFVIRNIANIVPPYGQSVKYASTTSAIEYAVEALGVSNIIICGHSNCGGCAASLEPDRLQGLPYTAKWVELLKPVRERVDAEIPAFEPEARAWFMEEYNVVTQLTNLESYPFIKDKLARGTLRIYGWHYDIEHGDVLIYNRKERRFFPSEEHEDIHSL